MNSVFFAAGFFFAAAADDDDDDDAVFLAFCAGFVVATRFVCFAFCAAYRSSAASDAAISLISSAVSERVASPDSGAAPARSTTKSGGAFEDDDA